MSFSAGGCWCRRWAEKGRAEWRYSSCPPKSLKNPANYQATKIYEGAENTGGKSPQGDGHKIGFQPPCRPVSIIGLQRVRHLRVFLGLAAFIDVPARPSVIVGGRLTQRADGADLVGPAQGIAEIPLNRLSIIPAAAIPFRPDRLERPPAYKPQAKAHRAYKPQPLPAVEAHVESRTSEDRFSIRTCSNR